MKAIDTNTQSAVPQKQLTLSASFNKMWGRGLPLIIAQLAGGFAAFWGMKLLADEGPLYSAAETPINSYRTFVMGAALIPFTGTNIQISGLYGNSENNGKIISSVVASYSYATIIGLSTTAAMMLIPKVILATNLRKELVPATTDFFESFKFSALPGTFMMSNFNIMSALDDTKPVAVVFLLGSGVAIFNEYGFIKGNFSYPKLGSKGLGYAILVENTFQALLLTGVVSLKLYRNKNLRSQFSIKDTLTYLSSNFKLGFFLDFISCVEIGAMFGMASIIAANLSTQSISAYNIVSQYIYLTLALQYSIRSAVTSQIGAYSGQISQASKDGTLDEIMQNSIFRSSNNFVYTGLICSASIVLTQLVIYLSITNQLSKGFDKDSDKFIDDLRALFAIMGIGQLADVTTNVYGAAFFGNTSLATPFINSLFLKLVLPIITAAVVVYLGGGINIITGGNTAFLSASAVSLGLLWHKKEVYKLISRKPKILTNNELGTANHKQTTCWDFFKQRKNNPEAEPLLQSSTPINRNTQNQLKNLI